MVSQKSSSRRKSRSHRSRRETENGILKYLCIVVVASTLSLTGLFCKKKSYSKYILQFLQLACMSTQLWNRLQSVPIVSMNSSKTWTSKSWWMTVIDNTTQRRNFGDQLWEESRNRYPENFWSQFFHSTLVQITCFGTSKKQFRLLKWWTWR